MRSRETSNHSGFTLMELIVVFAIIAILSGFLMPAMRTARIKAHIAKAEATIASLKAALDMYETDFGVYPTDGDYSYDSYCYDPSDYDADNASDDANNKVGVIGLLSGRDQNGDFYPWANPGDITNYNPNWHGPYMDIEKGDLGSYNGNAGYFLDPWGTPYVIIVNLGYLATDDLPKHNITGCDIYSFGPDKMTEGSTGGEVSDATSFDALNDASDGDSDSSDIYDKNDDDINNW